MHTLSIMLKHFRCHANHFVPFAIKISEYSSWEHLMACVFTACPFKLKIVSHRLLANAWWKCFLSLPCQKDSRSAFSCHMDQLLLFCFFMAQMEIKPVREVKKKSIIEMETEDFLTKWLRWEKMGLLNCACLPLHLPPPPPFYPQSYRTDQHDQSQS